MIIIKIQSEISIQLLAVHVQASKDQLVFRPKVQEKVYTLQLRASQGLMYKNVSKACYWTNHSWSVNKYGKPRVHLQGHHLFLVFSSWLVLFFLSHLPTTVCTAASLSLAIHVPALRASPRVLTMSLWIIKLNV